MAKFYALPETEHVWVTSCGDPYCLGCHTCNLGYCSQCMCSEGDTPTHCPGSENKPPNGLSVYEGHVDFRAGKWRPGLKNRVMHNSEEMARETEELYIKQLQEEGADQKFIEEARAYLAEWAE